MPSSIDIEIEDPQLAEGWKAFRLDEEQLHTAVLRELCARAVPLAIGSPRAPQVHTTLQTVDELNRELVFAATRDGMAVARALAGKPLWAAAWLHNMRIQLALQGATCMKDGERFSVHAPWPREIHRMPRRLAVRQRRNAQRAPLVRFHSSNQIGAARDYPVLDISEAGCALLLPAELVAPGPGTTIFRLEVELDELHMLFTDAVVQYVSILEQGTHRIGCRWERMPAAGQRTLARWLAQAPAGAAVSAGAEPGVRAGSETSVAAAV